MERRMNVQGDAATAEYFSAELVFFRGSFEPGLFIGVRDGTIVSVSDERPENAPLIEFPSAAIFPATVNTHTHTYLSLLRGVIDDLSLGDWLREVYATIPDFGPEESYIGAALSFGEMLLSGTTTVADFFYLNGHGNENVRAAIKAAHDLGIRVVMGRTFLDAEWGGVATRETVQDAKQRFRELRGDYEGDPLVEVSPAPHSLYGSSRPMIEAAFELAEEYDTLWYLHVSDSLKSSEEVVKTFGERTVPLLDSWGVLTDRLVSVHGLWLSEEELRLLEKSGGRISHNPASNMFFGERIIDIPDLLRRGLKVGLATDGAASNNSQNILSDTRLASLAQKVAAQDPAAITVDQLITLMTAGGAEVLNCPVGVLETGRQADFMVLDTLDFSLLPTISLKSNVVHAVSDRAIRHVYCAGRQVVRDGKLALVDHVELAARIFELTGRLHR
jgi:5-methylthioadenosine/S-adenosylhomocysteine deaminase